MFGIGLPEFILIAVVALIVVGPDKLPGLARTLGKQVLELKKAANSLKDSLSDELVDEKEQIKELTDSFDNLNDSLARTADNSQGAEELFAGVNPPPKELSSSARATGSDDEPVNNDEDKGQKSPPSS